MLKKLSDLWNGRDDNPLRSMAIFFLAWIPTVFVVVVGTLIAALGLDAGLKAVGFPAVITVICLVIGVQILIDSRKPRV